MKRPTLTSPGRFVLATLPILALAGCAPYNTTLERIDRIETRLAQQDQALADLRQQLDAVRGIANQALGGAQASERRNTGKVIETLTLTNDRYLFPFNTLELEKADAVQLDALATRLKSLGRDYHLVIQGHTEDSGGAEYNYLLGEARANAVRRYLHDNHGLPLQRMSVVSHGATRPVADGAEGKGNRRLVVEVTE